MVYCIYAQDNEPIVSNTRCSLENQMWINEANSTEYRMIILASKPLSREWGMFGFAYISRYYAEGYCGLIYNLMGLSCSCGIGIEQSDNPYRFGSILSRFSKEYYFYGIYEYGGSGYWWKYQGVYKPVNFIGCGVTGQRFDGNGIIIEGYYRFLQPNLTYLIDERKTLISIIVNF